MPPSASSSLAKSKLTFQSVDEKIDLVEGMLTSGLSTKASREEVVILVNEGLQKMKAELAEKMSRGDVDYAMKEYIDDQAAPRAFVEAANQLHAKLRDDIENLEKGMAEAITGIQATVTQFRMSIVDRLHRAVESGNYSQEKMRVNIEDMAVQLAAMEQKAKDAGEEKEHEKQEETGRTVEE